MPGRFGKRRPQLKAWSRGSEIAADVTAILLATGSALAYAACFPPFELPLSWVALVPLLFAIERASPARAALLGALWGAIVTASVVAWLLPTLTGYFEQSLPVALGVFAVVAFGALSPYFAACFALLAAARDALPRVLWLALVPAAFAAAEYARTQLGLRSSWALLGDAHFESARLRQIADTTAVYGVSALVVLGNAVLYETVNAAAVNLGAGLRRQLPRRVATVRALAWIAGAFAVLLAASLGYGDSRRLDPRADHARPDIAVVQGAADAELRWSRSHARRVLQRYASATQDVLGGRDAKPALVVWPEHAIQVEPADAIHGPALRELVDRLGVPLLLGAPRSELEGGERRHFNAAHLLAPGGAARHYDKMRLLPFSETRTPGDLAMRGDLDAATYAAGREPGLFDVAGERYGVLICFEAIYPELGRALAARGATALVNLSNDAWYRGRGGARQHFQQAVFRAIETGLPVVRATTTGISAVIAPDGAVVASLPEGEPGVLVAPLPARRPRPTPYARTGDVFAWSCLGACAAALARAAHARIGRRTAPQPAVVVSHQPGDAS
jgi:apolipoprotein N-acyltransferase